MIAAKLGGLVGGIGLFLLGMHLMTDGLKTAAGTALRSVLEKGTQTPMRGILSGALITAIVQSSSAAMDALFLELGRIGEISRRMCSRALSDARQNTTAQERDRSALNSLVDAVGEFGGQMRQNTMPEGLSNLLPNALRVSRYYSEAAELAQNVAAARATNLRINNPELIETIRAFEVQVVGLVDRADSRMPDYAETECRDRIQHIKDEYQALKAKLLKAGAEGRIQVRSLVDELDRLSNVRQIGEQIEKGARYLAALTRSRTKEDLAET